MLSEDCASVFLLLNWLRLYYVGAIIVVILLIWLINITCKLLWDTASSEALDCWRSIWFHITRSFREVLIMINLWVNSDLLGHDVVLIFSFIVLMAIKLVLLESATLITNELIVDCLLPGTSWFLLLSLVFIERRSSQFLTGFAFNHKVWLTILVLRFVIKDEIIAVFLFEL